MSARIILRPVVVAAIVRAGVVQLIRSRVYLNLLVAGVGLTLAALVLERVSAGEDGRVLKSMGLACASLIVAALATVVPITTVTRELETKEAHLMLARPITRAEFVVGRFLVAAALVVLSNLALGATLAGLLVATASPHLAASTFAAAMYQSLEGFVLAAFAIFFGVGSSSTVSAVFVTTLFVLGRLTGELGLLIDSGKFGGMTPLLRGIHAGLPHLSALDLTDHAVVTSKLVFEGTGYALAYSIGFVALAVARFNKRDLL